MDHRSSENSLTPGLAQIENTSRQTKRPSHPSNRIHRRVFNQPGHAHELTFCCFRRYPFLSKERTCEWLATSIIKACTRLNYSLWAFVFMPDHVHLIVRSNELIYDMSDFLALVKQATSRKALAFLRKESPDWLDKLKLKRGNRTEYHFWQKGGGFDRNITESSTLENMIDYIHLNPVRKGLVARAVDWKWSSANWFLFQKQLESLPVAAIPHDRAVGMSRD